MHAQNTGRGTVESRIGAPFPQPQEAPPETEIQIVHKR